MQAAAHTPGGFGGVPQSVGKEFTRGDEAARCAGMLLRSGRKYLLVKRVENGVWEQPGGHIEKGESPKTAAERETEEEVGTLPPGDTIRIRDMKNENVHYVTFMRNTKEFTPVLSDEHTDWGWFASDELPDDTHPEVKASIAALENRNDSDADPLTDFDMAKAIRDGMPSPQKMGDFWLFDMRITGSGAAYRSAHDEYAFRDPATWLTQEFVNRCNGLTVVFEHPDTKTLTSDEYRERSIGAIVLPYIKGNEVWGIAKIFDADAAALMQTTHASTSPGVLAGAGSTLVETGGTDVMVEAAPLVLDHLAVCEAGVWDKGGPAMGIRLDADDLAAAARRTADRKDKIDPKGPPEAAERKDKDMADEKEDRKDAVPEWAASLQDAVAKFSMRMDTLEGARKDAAAEDAAKAAEMAEKMDAKKDADCEDGEAKKDADEDKAEDKKSDAKKDRKDEMGDKDERKDAADIAALKAEVARLQGAMAGVTREPSFDEREAIGAAYRRADSLFQMLGMRAPEATPGESPIAYRKRLANKLKPYSKEYGDYRLDSVMDERTFDLVESRIYADADKAARSPDALPAGRLIPIVTHSNGHTRTEFRGDTAAAWAFFQPPLRFAGRPNIEQKGK